MDMPKDCYYCALYSVVRGHCPLVERGSFNEPLGHRHPDCPLEEVPEHGDLIDRDTIIEYSRSKGYNLVTLDLLEQIEPVIKSNKIEKGDKDE